MKFSLDIKNKKVSAEANIEKVIDKAIDHMDIDPNKKTRYQIKQEEKRKTLELKHKLNTHADEKGNKTDSVLSPSSIAKPVKKTRYQIKQEEKRKNAEQKHKHTIQTILIEVGVMIAILVFVSIMAMFEV